MLEVDKSEARKILDFILKCRGNAYLVNTTYRVPEISRQQARNIALNKYEEVVKSGKKLSPLEEGFDDILWWTFQADDIDAQAKGFIPGRFSLSVDKLDGHLRTAEEFSQWLALSQST